MQLYRETPLNRRCFLLSAWLILGVRELEGERGPDIGGGWRCYDVDKNGFSRHASNIGQYISITRLKDIDNEGKLTGRIRTIMGFMIPLDRLENQLTSQGAQIQFPWYEEVEIQVDNGRKFARSCINGFAEIDLDPSLSDALTAGLRMKIRLKVLARSLASDQEGYYTL